MANACDNFFNRPKDSYRPLACRPIVVTTRTLGGHGAANKAELFFVTKPNTIREHATLDLLFIPPTWLVEAVNQNQLKSVRETVDGHIRITQEGHTRVVTT